MEHTTFEILILLSLFVWRVSRLFCFENGPFNFVMALRTFLFEQNIGNLLQCFHCFSIWVSIVVCFIYLPFDKYLIIYIGAIAGVSSIIQILIINGYNEHEITEFE